MENNEGWIKLNRKVLNNPIVTKDSEYFSVWCLLLLLATHKDIEKIFDGKKITLKPGQLITGRKYISKLFSISESKVQRILKEFENEHQIEQQTSPRNRLISIVNWSEYQNNEHQIEQQVNNKRTTNEHIQEYKNIYLYFIKKYKEQSLTKFNDKMRFLHDIQFDEKYKQLSESEEYELRNIILGETNL